MGLNLPGECRYVVRKKGEAEPSADDWKSALPVPISAKQTRIVEESLLAPATNYVMYLQATPIAGTPLATTVEFTTLAGGVEPAELAAGYPKARATYSDAQLLELSALRACEMRYIVVPEKDLPTVDYTQAGELKGGVKPLEITRLPILELQANTPYVLCYATYYAGESPTLWKEYHFATKPLKELQPSVGYAKPGTQQYAGFVAGEKGYAISKATSSSRTVLKGWKMEGDAATITVATNATGEAVPGLVVATTGGVTLEYSSALSDKVNTLKLPATAGEARYYAFPKDAKLHEVKLAKETDVDVEVIAFASTPVPIEIQKAGVPQIPLTGGNVTLAASVVYGGVWPIEFEWKHDGQTLGKGLSIETDALQDACVVQLVATDAQGTVVTLDVEVVKQMPTLLVGGFEEEIFNERLAASAHQWKGPQDGKVTYYTSGAFTFSMNSNAGYYSGFVVSDDPSTEWDGDYSKDARSAAGHGANGTKNYGVAYSSSFAGSTNSVKLHVGSEGAEVSGVYLTNTAWTYSSVLNGPGGTGSHEPFAKGDTYSVVIKADNGKEVTKKLADYTNADASQHFALTEWAWVDLSSLGKVKELTFSVEAKCADADNFPTYFALDELGASRPEKTVQKEVGVSSATFDLLTFTTLDKAKPALTTVEVEKGPLQSAVTGVTLALEGARLKVEGWDASRGETTETFTFKLAQLGREEWVKLTLKYTNTSPAIVLASIAYDQTQGSVEVIDAASGNGMKENAALQKDQELIIRVAPKQGFRRIATADSLQVSNAERIGESLRWRVTGAGDVTVAAAFEKDASATIPTKLLLTAINFDPSRGSVVVKDQFGKELEVNAKLEKLQLIEVEATPREGYLLDPSGVILTNATRVAPGATQWQVTGEGDVTVTVNFEKSTAVEPIWAASLTLLPNPCAARLRVEGVDAEALRYEVYSVSGACVAAGEVRQERAEVDVSNLASGVYVLRLYDGRGASVSRSFARQ